MEWETMIGSDHDDDGDNDDERQINKKTFQINLGVIPVKVSYFQNYSKKWDTILQQLNTLVII